jgi:hypothetical protein
MRRRMRMLQDLDQDIREHIEKETQDNIERGMPPAEARYAALRKFGNVTRITVSLFLFEPRHLRLICKSRLQTILVRCELPCFPAGGSPTATTRPRPE